MCMIWTVETHILNIIYKEISKRECRPMMSECECLNDAPFKYVWHAFDNFIPKCDLWQPLPKTNIGNFLVWWYPRISNWTRNEFND